MAGMDRFTRNYAIGLTAVAAVALVGWALANWNPRRGALDAVLQADTELSAYVYRFRVLDVDGGTVTLSTPRTAELPVVTFLRVVDPGLAAVAQDDARMMAAQAELVRHQQRAQSLVMAEPGITGVRWELDREWYRQRGLDPDALAH
jgi:hypothetical protein